MGRHTTSHRKQKQERAKETQSRDANCDPETKKKRKMIGSDDRVPEARKKPLSKIRGHPATR